MSIISSEEDTLFLSYLAIQTQNLSQAIMGKVSRSPSDITSEDILFLDSGTLITNPSPLSYKTIIYSEEHPQKRLIEEHSHIPLVMVSSSIIFTIGDVISITEKGRVHRVFRAASKNNAFLVTEACNNLCLMCPQPPKPQPDNGYTGCISQIDKTIELIDKQNIPDTLCLTGGEPTMLKGELVNIIAKITDKMPHTLVHLLTNGRSFYYEEYAAEIARVAKGNMLAGIPLFAHVSDIHDYIVQTRGAFDQTMAGLLNCDKYGIAIELRVVLHKQTIPYLIDLAKFIARNLFFVKHVALMGMENMGFAKIHREALHLDPDCYKHTLSEACRILELYGIETRIFNLPLCVVNPEIHHLCAQSISDFKNIFYTECAEYTKKEMCCGFFNSSTGKHQLTSQIKPFH